MRKIKVEKENSGKRLDVFLMEQTEYSRSKVQKLVEDNKVLVNNNETKSSNIIRTIYKFEIIVSIIRETIT